MVRCKPRLLHLVQNWELTRQLHANLVQSNQELARQLDLVWRNQGLCVQHRHYCQEQIEAVLESQTLVFLSRKCGKSTRSFRMWHVVEHIEFRWLLINFAIFLIFNL
jgi:hypothetical protein